MGFIKAQQRGYNMDIFKILKYKKQNEQAKTAFASMQVDLEMKKLRFIRNMLPASIEEKDDLIVINDNIFVRCYIVGVQRGLRVGFPPKLKDTLLDKISMLSVDGAVISYAFEVFPSPSCES